MYSNLRSALPSSEQSDDRLEFVSVDDSSTNSAAIFDWTISGSNSRTMATNAVTDSPTCGAATSPCLHWPQRTIWIASTS